MEQKIMEEKRFKPEEKELFGHQYMEPVCRDENYVKWDCRYRGGRGTVTAYTLWPGMMVFLNDFKMEQFPSQILEEYHLLKINYCLEGRCEVQLRNHRYVYLQPGTVDVDRNQEGAMFFFPGERYLGLEYVIDPQMLSRKMQDMLEGFGILLQEEYVSLKAVGGSRLGLAARRTKDLLEETAEHLKKQPGELTVQKLRLITVQILADLCRDKILLPEERPLYLTKQQRQMVLEVYRELQEGGREVSVEAMAKKHHTSASSLEHYFKAMYGDSIFRYQKRLRMQRAKELLQTQREMPIREVALRCGYAHAGKFSAAFRQEEGVSPHEFRREALRTG